MSQTPSDTRSSNRPRSLVENCPTLDVSDLNANRALKSGVKSLVSEYVDDRLVWVASVEMHDEILTVSPAIDRTPLQFQMVRLRVCNVLCHYGGRQPFFLCPLKGCQKRIKRLYLVDGHLACRTCHGLSYASQGKDRFGRLLHQANKLRIKLGGSPGTSYPIAPRPKGMWQTTYDRMRDQIIELESQAWGHLADTHLSLSRLR